LTLDYRDTSRLEFHFDLKEYVVDVSVDLLPGHDFLLFWNTKHS